MTTSKSTGDSQHALVQRLAADWAPSKWANSKVLIAFSGGPDSTALLRSLAELQPDRAGLAAAHFNHQLRGADSLADQQFAEHCCRQTKVECFVESANPIEFERERTGEGIESAARQLRYRFLTATAERIGARYIVTGHTVEDRVETVLHHILRGTGLAGLAGIPRVRVVNEAVTIVRPLLGVHRAEIIEYLSDLGQDYRLDEANLRECFTRNRIRMQLLPQLESEFNPDVRSALLRLAQIAEEAHDTVCGVAVELLDEAICELRTDKVTIDTARLSSASIHLRRECFVRLWKHQDWPLQSMQFRHWQQLAELAGPSFSGRSFQLPGRIQASREQNRVQLCRLAE